MITNMIERIVLASIGTTLLGGLTTMYYQNAKLNNFKNVFENTFLIVLIICAIAFPICMIFC